MGNQPGKPGKGRKAGKGGGAGAGGAAAGGEGAAVKERKRSIAAERSEKAKISLEDFTLLKTVGKGCAAAGLAV